MKLKMIFNFIHMKTPLSLDPSGAPQESRCLCGNLLARLRREGVELKCRRCKRVMVIPWNASATWYDLTIHWEDTGKVEAK
jgi:phage FluMu protein Com